MGGEVNKPDGNEAAVDPRTQCLVEIRAVLEKHGFALVAIPEYKPDGRGGFFTAARIELARRG